MTHLPIGYSQRCSPAQLRPAQALAPPMGPLGLADNAIEGAVRVLGAGFGEALATPQRACAVPRKGRSAAAVRHSAFCKVPTREAVRTLAGVSAGGGRAWALMVRFTGAGGLLSPPARAFQHLIPESFRRRPFQVSGGLLRWPRMCSSLLEFPRFACFLAQTSGFVGF